MHAKIDLDDAEAQTALVLRLEWAAELLRVVFTDGEVVGLSNATLLFDAPDQFDAQSGQRLGHAISVAHAIASVHVDQGSAKLTFQDGAQRVWPFSALARLARPSAKTRPVRLWPAAMPLVVMPATGFMESDADLRRALCAVARDGVVLLKGAAQVAGELEQVVRRFGFVRETNYGRLFDVRVTAAAGNLAFTDLGLAPHTDNPYREPPPGLQLLHCLEAADTGGETLLVDGFAAAETLKHADPNALEALCSIPVSFSWRDKNHFLQSSSPVIERDCVGEVRGVRVNDRSLAPAPSADKTSDAWRAAYRRFCAIINDAGAQLRLTLEAGDILIFNNRRILHGRTKYSGGARWLQGCYADMDGLLSRLAVLEHAEASSRAVASLALLAGPAGDEHYGEGLSLRAHCLQAAALAGRAGMAPSMIAAALLHDIGWALGGAHESTGAAFLQSRFGVDVADPVRAHVDAKRYLVACEPAYEAALSQASRDTLIRQGGPMATSEAEAFQSSPVFASAIALRRIDEEAKLIDAETAGLDAYRDLLFDLALNALRGDDQ